MQFKLVISTLGHMENKFLTNSFTVNLVSLFWWKETGWRHLPNLTPDFSVGVIVTSEMGPGGRVVPGFSVRNPQIKTELAENLGIGAAELAEAVRLRCERSLDHLMRYGGRCEKNPVVTAGNVFADTDYMVTPGWAYYQAICMTEEGILMFGEDAQIYYKRDDGSLMNLDGMLGQDPYRSHLVRV